MSDKVDLLADGQQLLRLHEKILGEASKEYGMNKTEMGILLFLYNNPQYDTAKEIVEYRMMTKSCVSRAIDSLVKQGYLSTREDENDRRLLHLELQEKTQPVIEAGLLARRQMFQNIFTGISDEEQENFCDVYQRVLENTREALKGCGKN